MPSVTHSFYNTQTCMLFLIVKVDNHSMTGCAADSLCRRILSCGVKQEAHGGVSSPKTKPFNTLLFFERSDSGWPSGVKRTRNRYQIALRDVTACQTDVHPA